MNQKRRSRALQYWEALFPGHGQTVLNIIAPFLLLEPSLQSALPGLERRATDAAFWHPIRSVKAVEDLDDIKGGWGSTVEISLDKLKRIHDHLAVSDDCWRRLQHVIGALVDTKDWPTASTVWSSRFAVRRSLTTVLGFACVYAMTGQEEKALKMKRFAALYRRGNIPLRFQSHTLYCLVEG